MEIVEATSKESLAAESNNDLIKERYSYEEAVEKFGMGRYQLIICSFLSLVTWSTSAGNDSYVWLTASMNYTCVVPNNTCIVPNNTCVVPNNSYNNSSTDFNTSYHVAADQCSYNKITEYVNGTEITQSNIRCLQWTYDKTFFESTIISEWDLNSCNGKAKVPLVGSLYMVGFLAGCFIFGDLSDRFGRRLIFLVSHIGLVGSGIAAAYSVNLPMLIAMRFIFGAFAAGARSSGFVYMVEILTPKWRAWTGPVTSLTYWASAMLLTTTAMYTANWRSYQLILSLVCILFIPYYWCMHESPHWLLSQDKQQDVVKYFKRSAQINRISIANEFEVYLHAKNTRKQEIRYKDFVKYASVSWITVVITLLWCFTSAVAFGFMYNVGNMTGNIFTNMYVTLAGGPLIVFSIWVFKFGRRIVIFTGFCSTTIIGIILSILISYQHLESVTTIVTPILSGLGRVLGSFCFSGLYVITSELYATNMRVTALGIGSAFARVGGAISPFLALSSELSPNVPYILFATISAIAAGVSVLLPETLNKTLPESIHEMRDFFSLGCPCNKEDTPLNRSDPEQNTDEIK